MIAVAGILLALATLFTLLVVQLVADAHPVAGADAMGLIVVIPVLMGQWLVLAGGVLVAARRGALGWIHRSRVAQAIAASLWLAALGVTSSIAVVMAYGPRSDALVPWAFGLAVAVPAVLIVGTAASLLGASSGTSAARPWRLGAFVITLIVGAGALQMFRLEYAADAVARETMAVAERESAQFSPVRRGAFEALAPTAPLHDWLPWVQLSDDIGKLAIAAVRARPTLEQDVAAMLRSDEAPEALRFMWLWMPEPRSALAAPARDAIAMLPAWAEHWLSVSQIWRSPTSPVDSPDAVPALQPVDLTDMAQAAIVIAETYKSSSLDFETPIAAFFRVLERSALPDARLGEDPTYQPRAYLRTWLDSRAAGRGGRGLSFLPLGPSFSELLFTSVTKVHCASSKTYGA